MAPTQLCCKRSTTCFSRTPSNEENYSRRRDEPCTISTQPAVRFRNSEPVRYSRFPCPPEAHLQVRRSALSLPRPQRRRMLETRCDHTFSVFAKLGIPS